MTLPPLVLDDLTWETLTEAGRRRIPAASGGTWTLHAPVDPGMTVLELLAYLLEQRLYHLDQVPDELVVAILTLLGLDPPRPARPATTVLRVDVRDATNKAYALDAGTEFSRDPALRVVFTTDRDVTVLPFEPGPPQLFVDGRDRSADLRAERGVPVLPTANGPGEIRLEFALREPAGRPKPGAALTVLVDLDAPGASPPSWQPAAVAGVPVPAALTWQWYDPAHPGTWWPVERPEDGTGGLRRAGVVVLPLPAAWCAEESTVRTYGLRVVTDAATYATPPILRRVVPNTVVARHRVHRTVADADTHAWRRLPGQRIDLPDARGDLLDATVTITRGGTPAAWTAVSGWAFTRPGRPVFLIDRAAGAIRFGDGLTGGIPVPDAKPGAVKVVYHCGGGRAGNGGRTATWAPLTQPYADAVVAAENVVAADGGEDPETVAEARVRAADELAGPHRAVTAADFDALARTTPGVAVARCHVAIGAHPAYPCSEVPGAVTVRILPALVSAALGSAALGSAASGSAARYPDPGMLAAVRARLGAARLLGTELYVRGPLYRAVRLRVDVRGRPADPAAARTLLRTAMRRYLDPLTGGDGTGWPFGGALRPSALIRVAQEALRDLADVTAAAVGLDGAEPADDCAGAALRPGELPALDGVTLRVLPAPAGPGLV